MKPKVTFVISSLELGGAERVLSSMANYWARAGWGVSVVTMREHEQPFYELEPQVKKVCLHLSTNSKSLWHALANNVRRVRALRRFIVSTRPHVVISFMTSTNVVSLLATRFTGIPVLVSERTLASKSATDPIWRSLRRITYPLAERLIVQSTMAKQEYWPAIREKTNVISNPVNFVGAANTETLSRGDRPFILAVGRLEDVKRIDHLIKAFARIAPDHPAWRLVLVGDGSLMGELADLATQLGLAERVDFAGAVKDPFARFRDAGLYAICSEYEGMPNAMMEAMANGLPVVSYDSPGGIRDVVVDGANGVLVPPGDIDALAAAMAKLLGDPAKRKALGRAATDVNRQYAIDRIMTLWEAECLAVINKEAAPCSLERTI